MQKILKLTVILFIVCAIVAGVLGGVKRFQVVIELDVTCQKGWVVYNIEGVAEKIDILALKRVAFTAGFVHQRGNRIMTAVHDERGVLVNAANCRLHGGKIVLCRRLAVGKYLGMAMDIGERARPDRITALGKVKRQSKFEEKMLGWVFKGKTLAVPEGADLMEIVAAVADVSACRRFSPMWQGRY